MSEDRSVRRFRRAREAQRAKIDKIYAFSAGRNLENDFRQLRVNVDTLEIEAWPSDDPEPTDEDLDALSEADIRIGRAKARLDAALEGSGDVGRILRVLVRVVLRDLLTPAQFWQLLANELRPRRIPA